MKKTSVLSTLLLSVKYGGVAILTTAIFLPLPIAIGDYFGRINTVGHYSGPLPASWIFGLVIVITLTFSLPLLVSVCILNMIILFRKKADLLREGNGKFVGWLTGILATCFGILLFVSFGLLEALGNWIFIGIMIVWGMALFGWIGHRMEKNISEPS